VSYDPLTHSRHNGEVYRGLSRSWNITCVSWSFVACTYREVRGQRYWRWLLRCPLRAGVAVWSHVYRATSPSTQRNWRRPSQVGVAQRRSGARPTSLHHVLCGHVCRLRLHLLQCDCHADRSTVGSLVADMTVDRFSRSLAIVSRKLCFCIVCFKQLINITYTYLQLALGRQLHVINVLATAFYIQYHVCEKPGFHSNAIVCVACVACVA